MRPQVCLGTAQFGLSYGVTNTSGQVDEQEVRALLDEASSAGLSIIDTAQAYGDAEAVLGRAMASSSVFIRNSYRPGLKVARRHPSPRRAARRRWHCTRPPAAGWPPPCPAAARSYPGPWRS